ncbi:MAG: response regulator [Candidatus Sumerlaeota bacterium]|nr:response regulator [Candidatus Sumerlaeota bacterium]
MPARKEAHQYPRQEDGDTHSFGEQLIALVEIGNELSKAAAIDDLCRRAVELGRERLGFDRLSLWLRYGSSDCLRGTFGTDEQGNIRDERAWRTRGWTEPELEVKTRFRYMTRAESDIEDYSGQVIGKAMKSAAALWDGENIIGYLCVDNLLTRQPIMESQNQLLALYGMTLGNFLTRKQTEEETARFNARLRSLHEVGNELSRIASFDDLSRRAIELGREKLGFDRIGIWFFDKQNNYFVGSFGTDEQGNLRDERHERFERPFGPDIGYAAEQKASVVIMPETVIYDLTGQVGIGKAARSVASLWDGEETIGCISIDTLLTMRPLTEHDNQILVLYASTLGHLFTARRAEAERLKLEARFQQAQKMESLGILAGGIAHDFNNLLVGILGNADLALMELSLVTPACEYLQGIMKSAKRAAELTRQMLAYSGKGRFVVQPLSLNKVIEEMTHLLEVSISKKAVLRYNFFKNLPAVEADAAQMRQIVMNLVTNASEAIGEKSGTISISTGVMDVDREYLAGTWQNEKLEPGRYAYFEVSDTGCGMDKEMIAKIFDPFFTTKFTGRGLGLAAVLGIVRGHKGALKVYSEVGKGTTLKILFPAVEAPPAAARPSELDGAAWRGNGTVLLADDEEPVRAVAKRLLERLGFKVLAAGDGRETIQLFRAHADEIVLVVLDLTMPHLDGAEVFTELRRIRENIRVILSSGYNEQEVVERFAGKGLAGFIQKPYRYAELAAKAQAALEE